MKKRLLSLLMAVLMTALLLPAEAFAITGGDVRRLYMDTAPVTITKEGIDSGSQIYSMKMKNGKLVMFIATSGPHMGKSVTNSDRGYTATGDSFSRGVYEQARFTIQTGREQKPLTIRSMEVIDPKEEPQLAGVGMDMVPMENALTIKYTFSGDGLSDQFLCYISYYFVELAAGVTDGTIESFVQDADGRTYALVAQASWGLGMVTETTMPAEFMFRWFQDYHGFSRMGHARADAAAHVYMSRTYEALDGRITAKATDITAGLGRTGTNGTFGKGDIAEVYSDSYGVDNPFVLADVDRMSGINDVWTPVYMTYDAAADTLTAEGNTEAMGGRSGRSAMNALQIWGFRDVYTKKEAADISKVEFTKPDQVTIPQDANRLGLYETDKGLVAAPITDSAREAVLKKKYGDPSYTLCGNFETMSDKDGKYYEYTDGKAALTATITAVWGSGEHFRVRVDENGIVTAFDTTAKVRYSTPRFQLYNPVNDAVEPAELTFEDGCLTLGMDPNKNAVLVFIDIPQVSSLIDAAQIKANGDLVLTGRMGLDLVLNCSPDKLVTLEALGYTPKKEQDGSISFVQEGIRASGKIDTASLVGLELAELEASINTFDGEEEYDFSLELNAFDLFKTQAELQLKRLNNGRLAPNNLYFRLAFGGGIPIVPPVPTSFIKGGGGGFYGLADPINGDFIAIPPIRLKMSVKGDYVKVIEGWANVTVGPSYLEFAGTDMTIAKMDFIENFNMYLRLVGEKRTYQGISYTGLRAGGGMGITLNAPSGDNSIFEVEGSAEASVFGGLDSYTEPKNAYVQLDSRGSIGATVKIPKKLGSLNFRRLGGKVLAGTTVDFILGAQTSIPVGSNAGGSAQEVLGNITRSAWNNLSVYGGVSKKGTLLFLSYRIYYILPDHFGGAINLRWKKDNWTLEEEIEKNNWYLSGRSSTQTWSMQVADCMDAETGEQVGIAVVEASVYEVGADSVVRMAAARQNGRYTETIRYTAETGAEGSLGIVITPKNASVAELKKDLGLYNVADDTRITLIDAGDDPNSIPAGANMTEVEVDDGNGGTVVGLLIDLGADGAAEHQWRIEAGCDFAWQMIASAPLTGLTALDVAGQTASVGIAGPQAGKTYAVRYYLDTESDRSGENYFLGMTTEAPYSFAIPASGVLAPTGSYYVTAVLVEKVDFVTEEGENESSWITVDTQTSGTAVRYRNEQQPDAPVDVTLAATGNETLTAEWRAVDGADGYRVTLYYQENGSWKQAGASYVLDNADFDAGSDIAAASRSGGRLALRMAPTVGGRNVTVTGSENAPVVSTSGGVSDAAPANTGYYVSVEAFRAETAAGAPGDVRYFSQAGSSAETRLPAYTAPRVTVTTDSGQTVSLDGSSGYDSLLWNRLPSDVLFTVEGDDAESIAVTAEQGGGRFDVSGGSGYWEVRAGDADAAALIESGGRVLLAVQSGPSGMDTTEYYLRLMLDDVPPVITLDAVNVRADMTTGAYTVSGRTEPGLTVIMGDEDGAILRGTADMQGRFTFKGTLPASMEDSFDATGEPVTVRNGFRALVAEVTAQDEAGNTGIAPVLISARPEVKTNDPDDGGSGGSGGAGGGTSSSTGDPGVVLYAAAALMSLAGSAVLTGRKKRR